MSALTDATHGSSLEDRARRLLPVLTAECPLLRAHYADEELIEHLARFLNRLYMCRHIVKIDIIPAQEIAPATEPATNEQFFVYER